MNSTPTDDCWAHVLCPLLQQMWPPGCKRCTVLLQACRSFGLDHSGGLLAKLLVHRTCARLSIMCVVLLAACLPESILKAVLSNDNAALCKCCTNYKCPPCLRSLSPPRPMTLSYENMIEMEADAMLAVLFHIKHTAKCQQLHNAHGSS